MPTPTRTRSTSASASISTTTARFPLLGAVKTAEKARLEAQPPRGYQPIEGIPAYNNAVQNLLFGKDSELLAAGRAITCECLGGTGALKVGADYLKRLLPEAKVYISDPSWENHRALFESAGFTVENYAYYDAATRGVNFAGMKAALAAMPARSIVVLHACCHNPTGADLSAAQWAEVVDLVKQRDLVAFIDMAYQGFADGIKPDAIALDLFAASGLQFVVSSSFSKSFSLYGERVGALTIVTAGKDESARVLSQVKRVIRTNYSNPPTHGGAVVAAVLSTRTAPAVGRRTGRHARPHPRHAQQPGRQTHRRRRHRLRLHQGAARHVQLHRPHRRPGRAPEDEFGIYAVSTGRICVAALNTRNIDYVAKAIAAVLKPSLLRAKTGAAIIRAS
jgi:aromatic-amino-acid transaminase